MTDDVTPDDVPADRETALVDQPALASSGVARRGFLRGAGGVALGAGIVGAAVGFAAGDGVGQANADSPSAVDEVQAGTQSFWGTNQQGIVSPQQDHTYFAAFDMVSDKRADLIALLKSWTDMSAQLSTGQPVGSVTSVGNQAAADTGDAVGLPPAQLSLTFGFGPTLFSNNGVDRFGIAARRPEALVDLPVFPGDQLLDNYTGGDITVQAQANDPQVAFHAVRQLARKAYGVAQLRWTQVGSYPVNTSAGTPRNSMGFMDGTANPSVRDPTAMSRFIWVGDEGPAWLRGGSYLVVRRIRVTLENWDNKSTTTQESVFGRQKSSGAPLGGSSISDAVNLHARNADGTLTIPTNSHVRLAHPDNNGGAQVLRRVYNYNDGVDMFTERWPPWRNELEYDLGLLFCVYQKDPRAGFIRIYKNLAISDALNQFTTHTGSAIAAVPPGASGPGHFVGEGLFA